MLVLEKITVKSNPEVDRVVQQWERMEREDKKQKDTQQQEHLKKLKISDLCTDKALISRGLNVDAFGKLYCKICNQRFNVVGEFKPHLESKRHKNAFKEYTEQPQDDKKGGKYDRKHDGAPQASAPNITSQTNIESDA